MKNRILAITCFALAMFVMPDQAFGQVTIGFDRPPAGFVLTGQYNTAVFSSAPGFVNVVANDFELGTTAPNYLCTATDTGTLTCANSTFVDFPTPVFNLSFFIAGDDAAGNQARVEVFENNVLSGAVKASVDGDFTTADLVDLSAFKNVTRIEIINITDPGGIAFDDFSFDIEAKASINNGSNINPLGFFSNSAPIIGSDWKSSIVMPADQVASVLMIGRAESQLSGGSFANAAAIGELLCATSNRLDFAMGHHSISIPNDMLLAGQKLRVQGATIAADGMLTFNNAIDLTLGSTSLSPNE